VSFLDQPPFSTGLPAACHPMIPAGMTNTLV